MTFEFDDEKLKELNMTQQKALYPIQQYFREHGIDEIETGVFENTDKVNKYSIFGASVCFAELYPYFLKTISKWEWDLDEKGIENCLNSYIK